AERGGGGGGGGRAGGEKGPGPGEGPGRPLERAWPAGRGPIVVQGLQAQRVDHVDHGAGADRNAGGAQRARKADDVVGDQSTGRRFGHLGHRGPGSLSGQAGSLTASLIVFCSASPCMRAMSSWYFNSAPSVSPTTCGVSVR
ncbi:hypothetical protein QU38_01220, partial [Staphylococcus aureus]